VEQADAIHTSTSDTITFDSTVFGTPKTISLASANGPFVVSDAHSLVILGPTTGDTVTISGGDAIEGFQITHGSVKMSHVEVVHCATSGSGGGIVTSGMLTLTACTFDHDAAGDGGGVANLASGSVGATNCIFTNDASTNHTDVFNDGGGGLYNLGKATLVNCTFTNDTAALDGGGVHNTGTAMLTRCTLTNNAANLVATTQNGGGGIYNQGALKLTSCTLSNNSAWDGGGLFNDTNVALTTLYGCTFNNNGANAGGGGIYNTGHSNPITIDLTNCTLTNNTANASGSQTHAGGAIANWVSDTATLINCTISLNTSPFGGGIYSIGTLNLANTIVAGNTASSSGPDVSGTVSNIVGGNGNPVVDPRLGPLRNNGGPTQTMALRLSSPAIGQADDAMAPPKDQRGHARIDLFGLATDIGAYEYP
jgi:hypothetical protein